MARCQMLLTFSLSKDRFQVKVVHNVLPEDLDIDRKKPLFFRMYLIIWSLLINLLLCDLFNWNSSMCVFFDLEILRAYRYLQEIPFMPLLPFLLQGL